MDLFIIFFIVVRCIFHSVLLFPSFILNVEYSWLKWFPAVMFLVIYDGSKGDEVRESGNDTSLTTLKQFCEQS